MFGYVVVDVCGDMVVVVRGSHVRLFVSAVLIVVPAGHAETQIPVYSAFGTAHCVQKDEIVPAGITHWVQFSLHEQGLGNVSFVEFEMHNVAVVLNKHLRLKLPVPFL